MSGLILSCVYVPYTHKNAVVAVGMTAAAGDATAGRWRVWRRQPRSGYGPLFPDVALVMRDDAGQASYPLRTARNTGPRAHRSMAPGRHTARSGAHASRGGSG